MEIFQDERAILTHSRFWPLYQSGWTKIIRLVADPIMIGAADSLLAHYPSPAIPPVDDVKASLRQQIRYHCRLNHLAAHTSLWTLTSKELSDMKMEDLIRKIESFLDLEHGQDNILDKEIENLSLERQKSLSTVARLAFELVNSVKEIDFMSYSEIVNSVILDEMKLSKDLTAWPCESFWTVGENSDRLARSPAISDISAAMSPDCSSTMNSCFVQRDKCEATKDGICK